MGIPLVQWPLRGSNMAQAMHTVPESYQSGDDYQNCSYYSDLDLALCCHGCTAGFDFSE